MHAPNGQIQSSTDSVNNNWSYVYDDFNRLQSATQTSSGGSVLSALAWDYDRYGNRWHQRPTAGSGTTQQINYNTATNQATSGLSYDAAGDVVNDSYHSYSYDAEGRIAQVDGSISYIYDAEGRRVGKSDGTRYVVGLNGDVIDELNGSTWKRTEVYAGQRHLATVSPSGVTFNHVDWIGTERARTNPLGELCLTTTSQPYGDAAVSSTPAGVNSCSPTPDFLTGKPRDAESNLDDFGARYFGSRYGQWMSPDWTSSPTDVPYASMGNPQSMNLYAYVGDDPINGQDADGHASYQFGDGTWDNLDDFAKHEMNKAMTNPASNTAVYDKHCDCYRVTDKLPALWKEVGAWFGQQSPIAMGGAGALALRGGGAALLEEEGLLSLGAPEIGIPALAVTALYLADVYLSEDASDGGPAQGGGRNGQKVNPDRVQSAKDKIADLKDQRDKLASKANKTPKDKADLKKLDNQLKQQTDRMRPSENHSQKGKGPQS